MAVGAGRALTVGANDRAYAQIAPDNTLGKDSSRVTRFAPNVPIDLIAGGATRGVNLFHSFASLDVRGSFVATTANAIQFGDQGFFSASAPDVPPVLTVNPSALLFNSIATAAIANQSVKGLRVFPNRSLLLMGGNVELEGGQLRALQGGRVD